MANADSLLTTIAFDASNLWAFLEDKRSDPAAYDQVAFGIVAMDGEGTVFAYNRAESVFAGVLPEHVIGLNFFTDVAPCTNNYLVAARFEDEALLDETIDYIFTVKMRPTRVRLRMLKDANVDRQYLVVAWS